MSDTPAIGHNTQTVDYAKEETARLEREYGWLDLSLNELIAEGEKRPDEMTSDEEALKNGAIIKRFRDLDAKLEALRVTEKEPSMRKGNAIQAWFMAKREIIQPDDKKQRRLKPGWIDRLQAGIDNWQTAKENKERERLANIRREEQRKLEEARLEQERATRVANEAAAAALEAEAAVARARNPEKIEEKTIAAVELQKSANQAASAVEAATAKVQTSMETATEARVGTFAKSSDLVRTRGNTEEGGGVLLTTAKENYAILMDREKLDNASKLLLFAHLTDAEVEKSVRSFAKATQYRTPMPGCEIGQKTKGVTR